MMPSCTPLGLLVLVLAVAVSCPVTTTALPSGCTISGSELVSCRGFPASSTHLGLAREGLTSIKSGAFDGLTSVETVYLHYNQLAALPPGIFDSMTSLKKLLLNDNLLTSLPAGIFDNTKSLESLMLHNNQLPSLPPGILDNLTSLLYLRLNDNKFPSFPAGIFDQLTSLRTLYLDDNKLVTLPATIFASLTSLTDLRLMYNQLEFLPIGIFDSSTGLRTLYLNNNALSSLPAVTFDALSKLDTLYMANNQLSGACPGSGTWTTYQGFTFCATVCSMNATHLMSCDGWSAGGVLDLHGLGIDRLSASEFAGLATQPTAIDLSDNKLTALHYDTFAHQPATCAINVASNPCAQQPCGDGLQWYRSKQGAQFCASGDPPDSAAASLQGRSWLAPTMLTCLLAGTLHLLHRVAV